MHTHHVDRHGNFTLKQLRLSVLNEVHTNSYTGPRLTNHKSSGKMKKMESVMMDVVAEVKQGECLGIQNQASREVQVSIEAEVSHCHLLAKRRAGFGMHLVTKN